MASHCGKCGASESPDDAVFVIERPISQHDESLPEAICTQCWTHVLFERTLLSHQEAVVASLKDAGLSHSEVAEAIDISSSHVGTIIGRIREKRQKGARTSAYIDLSDT